MSRTAAAAAVRGWQPRWLELVQTVVRVHSPRAEELLLDALATPTEARVLAFVNAHAMNSAASSPDFFDAVMSADLVLRDGAGMAILMRLLHLAPGLNLNGTDLIPKVLRRYAGRRIALFGTSEPYLSAARGVVLAQLAQGSECAMMDGFQQTDAYVQLALAQRPELIVLGMGMPRQEEVAAVLRSELRYPCLIVCGGAIIDFLGGKTSRAPAWMRAVGLEWMFRLALEPKRLFRRYVLGNPLFIARALSLAASAPREHRGTAA
jgi:N-acetylglucosaminyldiphosphoundecaprenol N-acetyl-beta-D-mannosaminyltransferase